MTLNFCLIRNTPLMTRSFKNWREMHFLEDNREGLINCVVVFCVVEQNNNSFEQRNWTFGERNVCFEHIQCK